MKLTLPSKEDAAGELMLERGAWSGRHLRFYFAVCDNPVCQCEHLSLYFQPEAQSPGASPELRRLDLDLNKHKLRGLEDPNDSPVAADLARAVLAEMGDKEWKALWSLYRRLKQLFTEEADLDQIEAQFPAEVVMEGLMVDYYEILPYAAQIVFQHASEQWIMDDQC